MKRLFVSSNPFRPAPMVMLASYIVLGIWTFVVIFPIFWLVVTSLKLPIDVSEGPKYIPYGDFQPSLHAWRYLLTEESGTIVKRPYINTILVGTASTVIAIIIGALASYSLVRFTYRPKYSLILSFVLCVALAIVMVAVKVPWPIATIISLAIFIIVSQTIGQRFQKSFNNDDIAFWLISQRMLPPVAVVIPIYILFQQVGLLNTRAALIITYSAVNLPLVIWFLRDYFQTIPLELEESAFIDGASRFQVLEKIVLPLSVPGLAATFLVVLVFAWNEYLLGLFLSGADTQTMPVLVVAQNATRGPQWWNISALVLMMIIPVIILAILLERYITRGILVGAVKG